MIKILKQNISVIFLGAVSVIIIFASILFFLNNYKKSEFELFSKMQEQKINELQSFISIYNKINQEKLQTAERIFFDKINSSNPIKKNITDSIYIDLINEGISQKHKVCKILINNEILYLNNKLLNKNRYISNVFVSIWQRTSEGYIRIASSKAGIKENEIPILLKKSNVIISNINEGKHYSYRKYFNFDSEFSVFVPIFINSKIELAAEFSIPEYIPAKVRKIYSNKNLGFFMLNKNESKLIGNNIVLNTDKNEFLIKKILSLNGLINKFEYNNNIFIVSYHPENQIYIGFAYSKDDIFKNYYLFKKNIITLFILIISLGVLFFVLFNIYYKKQKKEYLIFFANLLKIKKTDKILEDKFMKTIETYYSNISENIIKLSEGNTSINIIDEFKYNEINEAILKIKDSLLKAISDQQKQEEENRLKEKFNKGNSEITSLLQHVSNVEDLSFNILKSIIKFLGIQQGAIFILNEKDIKNPIFEMSASYAYDKRRFADKTFSATEGLIGRAYLEKESIYITEVPENYTLIESGFGEEEPKFLLIVPLIFSNKVQAVVELGGINYIDEYKIKFVEAVGENIASTISNIKHSKQTEELLEQTTMQAKEIDEQRQTLEEKINTHRRQNRKLDKEMLQLIEIIESIKSVTFMFEYDLNGNIVDVSKKVIDLWELKKKDIINKQHKDIVKEDNYETKYATFWDELKKNKAQTVSEIIIINGKEYTFMQNYVPIKNVRRKIFRFLSLGTLKS